MTSEEIVIAGFGGQGILMIGQVLAQAGMLEGKHVSWFPSYGPEMRGGTANCSVVISDEPIGSPLVTEPTSAFLMNQPSVEKFLSIIRPGGLALLNSSLVSLPSIGEEIMVVEVPANDIAEELGEPLVANMVMLGAFVAISKIVRKDLVMDGLKEILPKHHHKLIPLNRAAFDLGIAVSQKTR